MASRVTSSASAPVAISDPIIDRIAAEGKRLSALNDMDLQAAVKEMPKEALGPKKFGDTILWLENMPYQRILKFCNAEQAGYLLSWITDPLLRDYTPASHAMAALNVMNTPESLPLFIEVVKLSRDKSFRGIRVVDLLSKHEEPQHPFYKALPERVLMVLKIDYGFAVFGVEAGYHGLIKEREISLARYAEFVRGSEVPDAPPVLADVSRKV